MARVRDVWVLADHTDGRFLPVVFELLAEARRIALLDGASVGAVCLGPDAPASLAELAHHGADHIVLFSLPPDPSCDPESCVATLAKHGSAAAVRLWLFPATSTGSDLAARLATTQDWPFFPRVVDIRAQADTFVFTRAFAAGRVHARMTASCDLPQIVTVSPGVLGLGRADAARVAAVDYREPVAAVPCPITDHGPVRADSSTLDIREAATIVAVGRGIGSRECMPLAEALARTLGGAVGGTRVIVDLGWLPKSQQIGQTGKTVRPRVYIACGLSGATRHVMGMQHSETVIAVNTDPAAPIFKHADLAVVADAVELLPVLTERCRRALAGT